MENNEKLTTNKQIIAFLAEKFPQCFTTEGEARPLKIGIFQDIAERLEGDDRLSKTSLRAALRHYTSSWRYLHGSREGAVRVDLDGNDCGALEAEHIEHARKTLKESKAKVFGARRQQGGKAANNKADKADNGVSQAEAAMADGRVEQKAGRKPANRPKAVKTRRPKPQPLDPQALGVGQAVKVLLGKRPVAATILELGKGEAQVQLNTGMTVKVKVEHLIG